MYYSKFDDCRINSICLIVRSYFCPLEIGMLLHSNSNSCDYFWLLCIVLDFSSIGHKYSNPFPIKIYTVNFIKCIITIGAPRTTYKTSIIMNIAWYLLLYRSSKYQQTHTILVKKYWQYSWTHNQIPNEYAMWSQLILIDPRHSWLTLILSSIPTMLKKDEFGKWLYSCSHVQTYLAWKRKGQELRFEKVDNAENAFQLHRILCKHPSNS